MKKSFLLFICLWMAFGASIYGQVKKIDTTMKLGNIGFKLVCSNKNEDKNFVTVSPIGFGSGARDVSFEVKGRIRKAEVDDLNNDFYPDMVMYVYTNDPNDKGTVVGISSIKNETLAGIGFPDIVDDPKLRTGYKGFDTFMLMEGTLMRRFPVYTADSIGAQKTGMYRQIQYKVALGDRGMLTFKPIRSYEFAKQ
ncbi:hypothetical protein [Sediminibacterium sp.]|uniref:hypothetical protein n=1 Tax=Sediminibacterium sp. TaxID=1917865 RepID=UPI002723B229|nr:hypothetical protein [Sediminibacterium sp.]MDO9157141.1 hypothetical protein [Sediminibacterium sp.]MDP1973133.1 hypothetical protein [Sediminibacterium sp.]MDP2422429.1 hypothetical protein [Sediminibacterium sp.]